MDLQALVERDSFVAEGRSAAVGHTVATRDGHVGVIVEMGEGRRGAWVHRATDTPDSSTFYSIAELRLATSEDLAQVGRWLLNRQYREHREIARTVSA